MNPSNLAEGAHIFNVYIIGSQPGGTFAPRGHLAISVEFSVVTVKGGACYWYLEARDGAKHSATYRRLPSPTSRS